MISRFEKFIDKLHAKRFVSLNFKLTAAILFAAVLALSAYFLVGLLESWVGVRFFASDAAISSTIEERYRSLDAYIEQNHVGGYDTKKLQTWIDSNKYTEIVIYDENNITFTSGWAIDDSGRVRLETVDNSSSYYTGQYNAPYVYATPRIDVTKFSADVSNRIVTFYDKDYYVYINVHMDTAWYSVMDVVKIIVIIATFFFMILAYNKRIINRIIEASDDVREISEGDLMHPVSLEANDEIGDLSTSVEILRQSLLEKTEGEQAALQANQELITSMSHDIRTPLTSLIGYIDIIAGGKYESEEDLQKYIGSCKDKAIQLKGLSDKLFNYFLVFGNEGGDTREFEVVDGAILFSQLILEHTSEIEMRGFPVNVQLNVPEGIMVSVDIDSFMRVFDNLFSNMMKYATSEYPIEIKGDYIQNKIKLIFSNHIASEAKLVESTKIGVKTCKKIVEDHGGTFHAMEEEKIYTTEILLNVVSAEVAEEAQKVQAAEEAQEAQEVQEALEAQIGQKVQEALDAKAAQKVQESLDAQASPEDLGAQGELPENQSAE